MYDEDGFQVANPRNRFALGDRDGLSYNADGSVDLFSSMRAPVPSGRQLAACPTRPAWPDHAPLRAESGAAGWTLGAPSAATGGVRSDSRSAEHRRLWPGLLGDGCRGGAAEDPRGFPPAGPGRHRVVRTLAGLFSSAALLAAALGAVAVV